MASVNYGENDFYFYLLPRYPRSLNFSRRVILLPPAREMVAASAELPITIWPHRMRPSTCQAHVVILEPTAVSYEIP